MIESQTNLPLLRCARTDIDGTDAFDNDLLDRRGLALKLTGYLDRLKEGAVLAIDAPWGEGKTWFGKNWAQHLANESHKTVYIDAFERDYVEDPFMLLTSEILDMIDDESDVEENLKKSGAKIAKALLPMAIKASINFGGRVLLGSSDVSRELQDAIESGTGDASELTSEWIKDKLDGYIQDKVVIQEFKDKLKEYAQSQEKPIVIFIDELDRCKPTFAVSLIERIKHFFDVPNIVFVLLLNRDQLEKAVKGVYGSETDGSAYLDKFITFFFRLPKPRPRDYNPEQHIERYVVSTLDKYNFPKDSSSAEIASLIMFFAIQFDLSLRDIERVVALYAFAYPVNRLNQILVYFIVIKQKFPSKFELMVNGDKTIHEEFQKKTETLLKIAIETGNTGNKNALEVFKEWHEAYSSEFETIGENYKRIHGFMNQWGDTKYEDMLPYFAKQIDLVIER